MTTKSQLQSKVEELENELKSLKEQLNNFKEFPTIQDAAVGDTLEDGSIVIKKSDGLALLMAPKFTEYHCMWSEDFKEVFSQIKSQGFNRSQWFVPTAHQLQIAMSTFPDEFSDLVAYWSCEEYCDKVSRAVFLLGITPINKHEYRPVRLFRCVTY